jgi:hypothetical protein
MAVALAVLLVGVTPAGAGLLVKSYRQAIDPNTNAPAPDKQITDFHMTYEVTGSRGIGKGNPIKPKVGETVDGQHVSNVIKTSEFKVPTSTVTEGALMNDGKTVTRTDTVALDWTTLKNKSFSFGQGLLYMDFGANISFSGNTWKVASASWSTDGKNNVPATIDAKTKEDLGFNNPGGNGLQFVYTNDNPMAVTLSGLGFQERPSAASVGQFDAFTSLDGTNATPTAVTIDGTAVASSSSSYTLSAGDTIRFQFSNVTTPYFTAQATEAYSDGTRSGVAVEYAPTPEPSSFLLAGLAGLGLGLVGVVSRRRGRRTRP